MFPCFSDLDSVQKLESVLHLLTTSIGYRSLTEFQQNLLIEALKRQSELDTHHSSGDKRQSYKHIDAFNFVMSINCHGSAYCVENQIQFKNRPKPTPTSFFKSKYHILPYSTHLQIFTSVLKKPFPSIVQISNDWEGNDIQHSCIALGKTTDDKDILIWEKQGTLFPFRLTTLRTVFNDYTSEDLERYWAVHSLQPLQTPR